MKYIKTYEENTFISIYETRVRVVSEEEINLELEKDKYNL